MTPAAVEREIRRDIADLLVRYATGIDRRDWLGATLHRITNGTLAAVCEGRLDPLPSVGMVIGLDGVPDALDLARKGQGTPRIVVHPYERSRS